MESTIGQYAIYKYLQQYGWTPTQLVADELHVTHDDFLLILKDMEKEDLVIVDRTASNKGVNIPLGSRGCWTRFWAKWLGY